MSIRHILIAAAMLAPTAAMGQAPVGWSLMPAACAASSEDAVDLYMIAERDQHLIWRGTRMGSGKSFARLYQSLDGRWTFVVQRASGVFCAVELGSNAELQVRSGALLLKDAEPPQGNRPP